jgi:Mn-dependent DtxR family transcriptional regulator
MQMSMNGYISSSSVSSRFSELERKGLIEYTGETRKGRSKRNQRVMRVI